MSPSQHIHIGKFKEWMLDNLDDADQREAVRIIQEGIY
jgi:hypothetical protein